jgi:hypothetical protein
MNQFKAFLCFWIFSLLLFSFSRSVTEEGYPSSVTLGKAFSRSLISQSIQAILLEKLGGCIVVRKNLAIASYTKALEVRNGKCFPESDRRGIPRNQTKLVQ